MDAHLARIDQKVKKLITITWVVAGLLSFVSWDVGFYLVGLLIYYYNHYIDRQTH